MIEKNVVNQIVEEWIEDKDYFVVDIVISPDNKIVVEIDHAQGVWIDDCVELSRFIESRLNRDEEDYELEVGSAGIGQPFKVKRQYAIHIGDEVEVLTTDGKKWSGILTEVVENHFTIRTTQKIKEEGAKRPKMTEVELTFNYEEVKYTKYLISFK